MSKKTIPLPFGTNDFIQVDREPEMEGICLFCGFLVLFDDSTKQDLVPLQVLRTFMKTWPPKASTKPRTQNLEYHGLVKKYDVSRNFREI